LSRIKDFGLQSLPRQKVKPWELSQSLPDQKVMLWEFAQSLSAINDMNLGAICRGEPNPVPPQPALRIPINRIGVNLIRNIYFFSNGPNFFKMNPSGTSWGKDD
jgi:hypothetical protein